SQPLTIGSKRQAWDPGMMPGELGDLLAGGDVPELDGGNITAGSQNLTIRGDRQREHASPEDGNQALGPVGSDVPEMHRFVTPAAGQDLPVRRQSQRRHTVRLMKGRFQPALP